MKLLKEKAAKFIVKQRLRRSQLTQQSFSAVMDKISSVLVLMPENEEDFKYAIDVINFFGQLNKEITILTFDYRVSLLPLKLRGKAIEHGIRDVNKFELPNKNLISRLQKKSFDAIIDLNRSEQLFYSYVSFLVDSNVRIGFQKSFSDKIYNIQIANDETNPKISYKNFLNCLKML